MKRTTLSLVILFTILAFSGCKKSEKKELLLNALFTDHMVLQQNKEVAFWGSYKPNEEITADVGILGVMISSHPIDFFPNRFSICSSLILK